MPQPLPGTYRQLLQRLASAGVLAADASPLLPELHRQYLVTTHRDPGTQAIRYTLTRYGRETLARGWY